MLGKIISVACAVLLLLPQSQEISLYASPLRHSQGTLNKRATSRRHSWWRWSSQDGATSGMGDWPSRVFSNEANQEPYYPDLDSQTGSIPRSDPYGSYGKQNRTTGYTGGKVPTKSSEVQQWLDYHNRFRAQYGAAPLKWSESLVQASKRLTDTCLWRHTQNNQYGENMAAGQSSIQEVVDGWVNGPDEKASYTGRNSEPSHFTQVVWISTKEVGCYHTTCREVQGANLPQSPVRFWGCNYNPPGNVIGEFAENVRAKAGGQPM